MKLTEQVKLYKEMIEDKNDLIELLKEVVSDQQAHIDFFKASRPPELPETPEFLREQVG